MALFQKPTSVFMIFKLSYHKNKPYASVVHHLDLLFPQKILDLINRGPLLLNLNMT